MHLLLIFHLKWSENHQLFSSICFEIIRYVNNFFLLTRISSVNYISKLCQWYLLYEEKVKTEVKSSSDDSNNDDK